MQNNGMTRFPSNVVPLQWMYVYVKLYKVLLLWIMLPLKWHCHLNEKILKWNETHNTKIVCVCVFQNTIAPESNELRQFEKLNAQYTQMIFLTKQKAEKKMFRWEFWKYTENVTYMHRRRHMRKHNQDRHTNFTGTILKLVFNFLSLGSSLSITKCISAHMRETDRERERVDEEKKTQNVIIFCVQIV